MDLFNKNKVKKLKEEIKYLNNEIDGYMKNERHWSRQIESLEKISTKTMEENQKLINWVVNILKEFGTSEVREKHISIPVYKNERRPAFYTEDDIDKTFCVKKEYIEIPSITIIKMG